MSVQQWVPPTNRSPAAVEAESAAAAKWDAKAWQVKNRYAINSNR